MKLMFILYFFLGLIFGKAIGSFYPDHDCAVAKGLYKQAVKNFRSDLNMNAGDELLLEDEQRKAHLFMDMLNVCPD